MSTDVPVRQYTCLVNFFFFGITCTMTFQLIYWDTYKQIHLKINLPVYRHASLSSNHKDLPDTTATCVHVHISTCSGPYAFICILSFRLTVKIYPSMFLLFCMYTDVPVHHYTCSVCFLFFGITCTMIFQLYCGTYTQILLKINLPVYPHVFLRLTTKTYLSPQLLVYMSTYLPAQDPTRSFAYFHSD